MTVRYARFQINADGMRGASTHPVRGMSLIRGVSQILCLARLLHQLHIEAKAL
jgi:hypothetical protein